MDTPNQLAQGVAECLLGAVRYGYAREWRGDGEDPVFASDYELTQEDIESLGDISEEECRQAQILARELGKEIDVLLAIGEAVACEGKPSASLSRSATCYTLYGGACDALCDALGEVGGDAAIQAVLLAGYRVGLELRAEKGGK